MRMKPRAKKTNEQEEAQKGLRKKRLQHLMYKQQLPHLLEWEWGAVGTREMAAPTGLPTTSTHTNTSEAFSANTKDKRLTSKWILHLSHNNSMWTAQLTYSLPPYIFP